MGRIIKELERIYDIKRGNNQHKEDVTIARKLTQQDVANKLGIDTETYRLDKKLLELIPELQDL
jgi:hypothetical protein